ncbi:MAG: hypothetical protein ABEJ36_00050 [Candidatus Nanosalina sp.]
MGRKISAFLASLAFLPVASAQITQPYGYYGGGILGLLSHLTGIQINNPYELVGITATVGVLWVFTYIIFKTAIKFMDENLEDGHSNYFADAVGLENSSDRNILAVLTLLIVLTMLGTGAWSGVIQGWQALIILVFLIGLLAATMLVFFGGAGAVIGGTVYGAGLGARGTVKGVEQLQRALDEVENLERDVEDRQDDEEDRLDDGDEGTADEEAELDAEEIERIINIVEEVEEDLNELLEEEEEEIEEDIERLRTIIDLLGGEND